MTTHSLSAIHAKSFILSINGGSSSIKFSLFALEPLLVRTLAGSIEGIGHVLGNFEFKSADESDNFSRPVVVTHYSSAVELLMNWIRQHIEPEVLAAVGHRIVHGGPKYWEPQRITPEMIDELRLLSPFDPEHLPEELSLIEAFHKEFPGITQIACFDTAFHHDMPRIAQLLPIPRRYEAKGIRRYGFHGLSYSYLIQELEHLAGVEAAQGRVILAHLGNGASVAALHHGSCLDTSMAFTPSAGLVMGTRSGDIDPGLISYMWRSEQMTASEFDTMMSHESGLLGVSETSADMRDLLACEGQDIRAAEAVALFCYQVKKWIGSYAAVLGGLDTLVFAGGIGEHAPTVRSRICSGLEFLGIGIEEKSNASNVDLISTKDSQVEVRVIHTDEELSITRAVCHVLGINA